MWPNQFSELTEEEKERLSREGITISIAALIEHSGLPDYRKLERYLQWKELKQAVIESKRNLREYEELLDTWELREFKQKYSNEWGK